MTNSKQIPITKFKIPNGLGRFGIWVLKFVCDLVLVIWNFLLSGAIELLSVIKYTRRGEIYEYQRGGQDRSIG